MGRSFFEVKEEKPKEINYTSDKEKRIITIINGLLTRNISARQAIQRLLYICEE